MNQEQVPDIIIGIDLGTTNSLVACADGAGPRILGHRDGDDLLPSVVRLGDGPPCVGEEARRGAVEYPESTVYSIKRLMGRGMGDLEQDLPLLAYDVVEGAHDTARVRIDGEIHAPQEISAIILRELRSRAEEDLGFPVKRAVVTVPAYFDDTQRQATRDAGRLAGLDVVRIVNEPTAAALAYGIGQGGGSEPGMIAVFDLGGGTFDISLLRVIPGMTDVDCIYQVVATGGDTHLGGDDVDYMIIEMLLREAGGNSDPGSLSPAQRQAYRRCAESAKKRLSEEEVTSVLIDTGDGEDVEVELRRSDLEEMMEPWINRAMTICRSVLRDAGCEAPGIDQVVLVGGATRIPLVRRMVRELFGREPYVAVDPERIVALGAAVLGGMLSGASRDALLLDVIPLSLGIETVGGAVSTLIPRNASIPSVATEMFSTSVDGQVNVKIHVLQGERELVQDCRSLGEFDLRGIPPMPAGIPQIAVEFLVDDNGILGVSAVERRSGRRASIQVVPHYGLSRDEVEEMARASVIHAAEDMAAHRIIDLVVHAKLDISWIEKALERVGDQVPSDYRDDLETRITDLRAMIGEAEADQGAVDPDCFMAARQELDEASIPLQECAITISLQQDHGG